MSQLQPYRLINPAKLLCAFMTTSFIAQHQERLIVSGSLVGFDIDKKVQTKVEEGHLPVVSTSTSLLYARAGSEDSSTSSSSEEGSVECRRFETGSGGRMAEECSLLHVDFEVHGTVQGVFFRKYTQAEGNKLGLRGFCRNTSAGTVSGSMEGSRQTVDKMKYWLQNTGSPMSRISKAVFTNEKPIEEYTFPQGFDIKRTI